MKLGVVIPTHDRDDELRRAVRSALDTDADVLAYVVFDAARPALVFHPRLTMLRGAPGRLGESRRRGVVAARRDGCDAVVELDDDDVLLRGGLAALRAGLERADAVYADFAYENGCGPTRTWKPPYEPGCFRDGCFSTGVRGYRVAAYDHVGGHNKLLGLCEDYDLFIRFDLSDEVRVAYVPSVVARVAHRGDGLSTVMYPEFARKGRALVALYYPDGTGRVVTCG